MDRKELTEIVQALDEGDLDILGGKSNDYSRTDDVFSAFRFIGKIIDEAVALGLQGARLAFWAMRAVKMYREMQLETGKQPVNEKLDTTFSDDSNYIRLHRIFNRAEPPQAVQNVDEAPPEEVEMDVLNEKFDKDTTYTLFVVDPNAPKFSFATPGQQVVDVFVNGKHIGRAVNAANTFTDAFMAQLQEHMNQEVFGG